MGVFSYLSLKRPAAFIWKTFSPGRELGEDKSGTGSEVSVVHSEGEENDKIRPTVVGPVDERRASIDYVLADLEKSEFGPAQFGPVGSEQFGLAGRAQFGSQVGTKTQGQLFCAVIPGYGDTDVFGISFALLQSMRCQ